MAATRAVLFDLDGTLIDSRGALLAAWHASTTAVLGRLYPANADEENVIFTLPGKLIWPTLVSGPGQQHELVEHFQAAYEQNAHRVTAFAGVPEMLRDLSGAGVAIGVVTSKARRRYGPDMEHAGLDHAVDVAICADDVEATKPDPEPLRRALELLRVAEAQAVMVGDTAVDVAAGHAAGTGVIGVTWGHASEDELREAGATTLAHAPHELVDMVISGEGLGTAVPSIGTTEETAT